MKKSFQKLCKKIWHKKWLRISLIVVLVVFIFTQITTVVSMIKVAYSVVKIGPETRGKLKSYYTKAGLNYPGDKVAFLIFDEEKIIELWTKSEEKWHLINTYPAKKNSISIGEGSYKIVGLNSNILYSCSMRLHSEYFENTFDIFMDRTLSEDSAASGEDEYAAKCFWIGDNAFEELFILAHDINIDNVEFIRSPLDMRKKDPEIHDKLTRETKKSLEKFK